MNTFILLMLTIREDDRVREVHEVLLAAVM